MDFYNKLFSYSMITFHDFIPRQLKKRMGTSNLHLFRLLIEFNLPTADRNTTTQSPRRDLPENGNTLLDSTTTSIKNSIKI